MSVLRFVQPKLHSLSGGLFANWLPNNMVEVGDFGILRNSRFERHGSLREYGAEFGVEDKEAGKANLDYKDKIHVDFDASASVDAGRGQTAKVVLKMADRGAFLYHLSKMMIQRPKSNRQFNEQIAAALINPALIVSKDFVLVTEVHHAEKATIVVSDSSDCSLDIYTNFTPGGEAFLSGAKGGVKVGNSRGSVFNFTAQSDMVTLLKIVRPSAPPGGPGESASLIARSIDWVRDLIAKRHLDVNTLSLTYVDDTSQPHVVVAESNGSEVTQIALVAVAAEEMVATDEEDVMIDTSNSDNIEVQQQQFGSRYAAD